MLPAFGNCVRKLVGPFHTDMVTFQRIKWARANDTVYMLLYACVEGTQLKMQSRIDHNYDQSGGFFRSIMMEF